MISLIIPAYFENKSLVEMTLNCIRSNTEEVELILVANKASYSVNVNAGLRAATGDILVIGNNDLTFKPGWLTELLKPLEMGYDVATCWTSDQHYKLEDRIEDNAKFGSIFAMKRGVYETIGGFDEQFGGYFCDTDMRNRILNCKYKIGKNLNYVIQHKAKSTYKEIDPDDIEYLRSMRLYEIKWGEVQ